MKEDIKKTRKIKGIDCKSDIVLDDKETKLIDLLEEVSVSTGNLEVLRVSGEWLQNKICDFD